MRDGGEQSGSELVRRGENTRLLGPGLELPEVNRGRQLTGEGVENAPVLAPERRTRECEHVLGVELDQGVLTRR